MSQAQFRFLPPSIKQQIGTDFEEEEDQLKAKGVVEFIRSFEGDMNKLEYFMNRAKKTRVVRDAPLIPTSLKGKTARPSVSIRLESKGGMSTIFPGPRSTTRKSMNMMDSQLSMGTKEFETMERRQYSALMRS